ncbi:MULTISPECIES: FecCD family ABC transporter permease [unclassified Nocardioides]|uniref:FecCD family ABC transporter permease n=1 Tax=unclassified Nocardioides TaxID=2615069 RepID=UPI0009F009FB|nr:MULTISPECIES: iron ABC transporter permease [unclassified Nocardioides]GAW52427.1 Ferric enterobactin transporter permease component [Nocardioides sp. PD653-B2]GAW56133.1 Ferric enterobactin transporter permease component [Nocardioides sp. PD653]
MTATVSAPASAPPGPPDVRRGTLRGIVGLALLLAFAALLSLAIGSRSIPLTTVVDVLLRPDGSDASTIVHGLRIPRTVLAIAVGVSLGVAGALMQGHTRNPLADPGLLGVEAGAAFAVVIGIFVFGVTDLTGYAWFSLVGAGVAAAAVFAIGSTRGGPDPVSLVLAGAAVSALLLALTQAVVLRDVDTLDAYRFWAVGSVSGRDTDVFWQVLPFIAVGLGLAATSASTLNLLQLGDDVAASLGLRPMRHRMIGVLGVMMLTGAATAACGPVGFVGLVVPHVARFLAGVDYRWVIPYSGLVGGLLVVLADIIGRVVVRPAELQVGIVMALIGGPVFIVLVRRNRMVRI